MTPLDKTLKRSLSIDGADYVVTLTPEAIKLTRKGKRLGIQLKWTDITSGEAALAIAEEHGHAPRGAKACHRHVEVAVVVEIAQYDRHRDRGCGVGNRSLKRSVAVSQEHGHGIAGDICDHDVRLSIMVEIGGCQGVGA